MIRTQTATSVDAKWPAILRDFFRTSLDKDDSVRWWDTMVAEFPGLTNAEVCNAIKAAGTNTEIDMPRSWQLRDIVKAIRDQRVRNKALNRSASYVLPQCPLCHGSGWLKYYAEVIHGKSSVVTGLEWKKGSYHMVIECDCPKGQAQEQLARTKSGGKLPPDLVIEQNLVVGLYRRAILNNTGGQSNA